MTTVAVALLVTGWCAGWLLARASGLPRAHTVTPRISVVVPARNEAARLRNLFGALDTDGLEVVVVDDDSDDDTASVARAFGAAVIPVAPPPGWTGKAWACWQGAQHASGDVIVFVDADVEPARGFVDALAAHAAATRGLASALPWQRTVHVYEQLSLLPNLVTLMGTGTGPAARRRRWWRAPAAFGMIVAVPRDVYLQSGGHAASPGSIVDDLDLARTLDAAGAPVSTWRAGPDDAVVRMYGEGPRRLLAGWVKNLASGARRLASVRLTMTAVWVAALVQVTVLALGAGSAPVRARAVAYALFALQTNVLGRRVGRYRAASALVFPIGVTAFLAMFVRSTIVTALRRQVSWRDRRVRVGASP